MDNFQDGIISSWASRFVGELMSNSDTYFANNKSHSQDLAP